MAGIGFILRKLSSEDSLTGTLKTYFHASMATSGPWIFTTVALAIVYLFFRGDAYYAVMVDFQSIILYNFLISLAMVSPISLLASRYISDAFYIKDLDNITGTLVGGLTVIMLTGLPITLLLYFWYANFPFLISCLAIMNFIVVSGIWYLYAFVSALTNYKEVTASFLIGLIVGAFAGVYLGVYFSLAGLLIGFTIGLAVILAGLIAIVLSEYPKKNAHPFKFFTSIKQHWDLALGAFCYNLGLWIDKFVMWSAPEAMKLPNNLVTYPNYEIPMFFAFLTIIPGMAMFLLSIETIFHTLVRRFHQDIQGHATLEQIEDNQQEILYSIRSTSRNLVFLQSSICIITLFSAHKIFDFFDIRYIQMSIFRYGVLGTTFQALMLYVIFILWYFNNTRAALVIQFTFLVTNAAFTYVSMRMGFPYYGIGYFVSALVSFAVAGLLAENFFRKLIYYTFIQKPWPFKRFLSIFWRRRR
jgi:uncharacterized membrane protein